MLQSPHLIQTGRRHPNLKQVRVTQYSHFVGVVSEVGCDAMTLKSKPQVSRDSISGLFQTKEFLVPTFQREYSWKQENVDSLLEDIGTLVEQLILGAEDFYYLGQIVLTKEGEHEGRKRATIVDGQQRLVTLQLIFIYLWRRLETIGSEYDTQFRDMVLTLPEKDDNEGEEALIMRAPMRVVLSEGSDQLLRRLAVARSAPDALSALTLSEKNIINAYETICSTLNQKEGLYIKTMRRALQHNTYISVLEIESLGEALEIFEILNQRGLDLSDSDLMKNFLFSQVPDKQYDKISKTWKLISKNVFKLKPLRFASLNLLLRAELTARIGSKISNSDLLDGWKIYLLGNKKSDPPILPKQEPKKFVEELEAVSEAYCNLTKLKKSDGTDFKSGEGLSYFNSVQHMPILLAGRKLKNIEVLMELVESRVLLSLYASEGPQNFEKIVPGWAKAIYDLGERNPNASDNEIRLGSAKAFEGEEELWNTFELKFTELQYGKDTKKIRFALARVLAKLEQECHNKIDYRDYTKGKSYHLDHTEPQSPDVSARRDQFKIGSMDLIESIGNLVILKGPINQSLSNKPPEQKIGHYLESNWVMPMMLCPKERWNIHPANRRDKVEQIQERFNFGLENWTRETIWERTYFCMTYFARTFTHFSPPLFAVPELPAAGDEGQ